MRIVVVFLALIVSYGLVGLAPLADDVKVFSIDLGGVTGGANNMVLAFGRYVLVAPFAPSNGVMENGDLDLDLLDNDLLYLIDTKKPNSPAVSKELQVWDPRAGAFKKIFYPSRLVFDPKSNNLYVRGTIFEEDSGQVTPIDVIAYLRVGEDDAGKPVLDNNVVAIRIPGVSSAHTSDAPLDMAFSSAGDALVFTNGASVYSFNLAEGFLQEVNVIDPKDYGPNNTISFLSVDQTTNIVSVGRTRKSIGKGEIVTASSDLVFYWLNQFGSFQPLKQLGSDAFMDGEALGTGSNIVIMWDPDKDTSETALFITNFGALCSLDLRSADATLRRLYTYPELVEGDPTNSSPITLRYDAALRTIGIVKPGFTIQISRPTNGKRGRISRPTNIHIMSGTPLLALARLNKKGKVGSVASFSGAFADEGGLSNTVSGQGSELLVSTYSGKLYSVSLPDDLAGSTLRFVTDIGSNVDQIDYYSDRNSIVAINSFTPDDGGFRMASRGSLVVARISQTNGALIQALLPTASALIKSSPSIRRPCNIRR